MKRKIVNIYLSSRIPKHAKGFYARMMRDYLESKCRALITDSIALIDNIIRDSRPNNYKNK